MVNAVRHAKIVDEVWYVENYPDVLAAQIDPVEHYVKYGAIEERSPSANFDLNELKTRSNNSIWLDKFIKLSYSSKSGLGLSNIGKASLPYIDVYRLMRFPKIDVFVSKNNKCNQDLVIIIPVFNAFDKLDVAIDALLKSRLFDSKIIIINDASSDSGFKAIATKYQHSFITYAENESNIGFSGTVNTGIEIARREYGELDVVILNSDTIVSEYWLQEILLVAHSDNDIGSVTSISNQAGPFSMCSHMSILPSLKDVNRVAELVRKSAPLVTIEVPTGHGFCMYMSSKFLDEVGTFDQDAFPMGYGEENDLCMRGVRVGWRNVIALRSFVYHEQSSSFGNKKKQLVKDGRDTIDQRYPEYKSLVTSVFGHRDFKLLKQYMIDSTSISPDFMCKKRILFVISTETGGTPQTNLDLMKQLSSTHDCFLLVSDSMQIKLLYLENLELKLIFEHRLSRKLDGISHKSSEYDSVLVNWLAQLSVDILHVRHIAWHSLGLFDMASSLKIPVVFSFHDFYTLCPTVKLIDGDNNYCAGHCREVKDACVTELWPSDELRELNKFQIYNWRRNISRVFPHVSTFVTTSDSAKRTILDLYPQLSDKNFLVVPHGRDFDNFYDFSPSCWTIAHKKIRLVCPGNLNIAKGLSFINELAENFSDIVEIHVIGKVSSELSLSENLHLHGEYKRENLFNLIEKIEPNIGGIFSIWPETWCHTLTELLACGIPVVSFGMGAVEERVKKGGFGWILKTQSTSEFINLIQQENFIDDWHEKKNGVRLWQKTDGKVQNTYYMAAKYREIYNSLAAID